LIPVGRSAPRRAANERDHAEVARERAAVLNLDEGADPVETRVGLDAADCADVPGDELDRLVDPLRDHDHVVGDPGEGVGGEVGRAAGHVDARVRPRGAVGRLARLADRLVGHAAGVDHGDVRSLGALVVAVGEQPLAELLQVAVRDLAAEESGREARHRR